MPTTTQQIDLRDGRTMLQLHVVVAITRYDLIGVACWMLFKKREMSRESILVQARNLIENSGTSAFVRAINKYASCEADAVAAVDRYFPELREKPTRAISLNWLKFKSSLSLYPPCPGGFFRWIS
jgi:hypothetical protein